METKLYAIHFRLGNEGQARFLESRIVVRATSKEDAKRIAIEERQIPESSITGVGTY